MSGPAVTRRQFLASSAAGGLSLAFHLPFAREAIAHGETIPELNAWVVVRPDDTVVVRIARSEMGQGTLTGLAQMVAEELGCDWAKVTTEQPTPGRIWRESVSGATSPPAAVEVSVNRRTMSARAALQPA